MKQLTILLSLSLALASCGSNDNTSVVKPKPEPNPDVVTIFTITGDTLEVAELRTFFCDGEYLHGYRTDGTEFYTTLPYILEEKY